MKAYSSLSVALVCFAGYSCGVDNSEAINENEMDPEAEVMNEESALAAKPDDSASPRLTTETKDRVATSFEALRREGALGDQAWGSIKQMPKLQYGTFILRNDADRGIRDGFAHVAYVPAGPCGDANNDPNRADEFYVLRAGGIGGWVEVAGPFELQ